MPKSLNLYKMKIDVLKTFQISELQWIDIVKGFNESFDKKTTKEILYEYAINTFCEYSYHALAITDEGELAGYNVFTPTLYRDNVKIVVSGSTFVRKKFRKDIFIFNDMVSALRERCVKDGFTAEVGVPNKNSKAYALKFLDMSIITDLNYYLLPITITKILKKNIPTLIDLVLRRIFIVWSYLFFLISNVFNFNEKKVQFEIRTDNDFYKKRFHQDYYHKITKGNIRYCYRIINEDAVKTAYIMDFRENDKRTFKSLSTTVVHILHKHKVDAILFVGLLRMKQAVLFKVPKKYIPKQLTLTYYLYDVNNPKIQGIGNSDNWNFSLMNFDVR